MDDSTTRTIHAALQPVLDAVEGIDGAFASIEEALVALRQVEVAVDGATDELMHARNAVTH